MTDDLPLFRPLPPMTRVPDHQTSTRAAHTVRPVAGALRARILQLITDAGDTGYTDHELRHLSEFADYAHSTVGKRRTELFQQGWLTPHGTRDGYTVWVRIPTPTDEAPAS